MNWVNKDNRKNINQACVIKNQAFSFIIINCFSFSNIKIEKHRE